MEAILSWLAPIVSTIITAYATTLIARGERKREEKRQTDAERWEAIDARLDEQEKKMEAVLKGQTTQMRSDLVHKAHRYIDDLGCASMEEKSAFRAEYEDYCEICRVHSIKNSFVDELAKQVMALPGRSSEER